MIANVVVVSARNIDDLQKPALGNPIVTNLGVTGEIDPDPTAQRGFYRGEKVVRIGIEDPVRNPGGFTEASNPAVNKNYELRRPGCSHGIGRK